MPTSGSRIQLSDSRLRGAALTSVAALLAGLTGCGGSGGGSSTPPVLTPTLAVAEPAIDQTLPPGDPVVVRYAPIDPLEAAGIFNVFADRDGDLSTDDDRVQIVQGQAGTEGDLGPFEATWDTTGIDAGNYTIFATLQFDGRTGSSAAPGRIRLNGRPSLELLEPVNDITVSRGGRFSMAVRDDDDDPAIVLVTADVDGDPNTAGDATVLIPPRLDSNGSRRILGADASTLPEGDYAILGKIEDGVYPAVETSAPGRLRIQNLARANTPQSVGDLTALDLSASILDQSYVICGHVNGMAGDVTLRGTNPFTLSPNNTLDEEGFYAQYDVNGEVMFARFTGRSSGVSRATSAALLPTGQIFIAGTFTGRVDFGSSVVLLASGGAQDVDGYIASYNSIGNLDSVVQFSSSSAVTMDRVSVNPFTGNAYISGTYEGTLSAGGQTLTSNGGRDIFLARFDDDTGPVSIEWLQTIGGPGNDTNPRVISLAAGEGVGLTAEFTGTVSTGGGTTLTAAGGVDVLLARYDFDGNAIWARRLGSSADEESRDIITLSDGSIAVAGVSDGADITFAAGEREQVTLVSLGGSEGWVARYDAASARLFWATLAVSSAGEDDLQSISATRTGGLHAHGFYGQGNRFAGEVLNLPTSGATDGFSMLLDVQGTRVWTARHFGPDAAEGAVASDTLFDNSFFLLGSFGSSVLLGAGDARQTTVTPIGASATGQFTSRINADGKF